MTSGDYGAVPGLGVFGRHRSRLATGVRANFAARASQGGSHTSGAPAREESGVRFISRLPS